MASKFLYIIQYDRNYLAKALAPKYPDVGLPSPKGPIIVNPHLKAEVVSRGLRYPTSMTFLGPNDILVTEKDAGTVRRVNNQDIVFSFKDDLEVFKHFYATVFLIKSEEF